MQDAFGRTIRYLRLSITDRCNLRCRYCMPAQGVQKIAHASILTLEEIVALARVFTDLGTDKIRITGGEPTVRRGLPWLTEQLARLPVSDLSMTTNGTRLSQMAQTLANAGLSRVNISLDTLDEAKYRALTRGGELSQAWEGIEAALVAGLRPVKLNCVLSRGINDDEIEAFAELTRERDLHVRFIERMPIGEARTQTDRYLSAEAVLAALPELSPLFAEPGSVAKTYALPGARGTVGLIRPMSDRFCASCNRVRITSEGKLKLCLHAQKEYDLRTPLRQGDDLHALLRQWIRQKPAEHCLDTGETVARNMSAIGG